MMLHAKYERYSPYDLGQDDLLRFPSFSLCEIREPKTRPISTLGPLFEYLVEGHQMMLHAIYDSSSTFGLGQDFLLYLYVKSENPPHREIFDNKAII